MKGVSLSIETIVILILAMIVHASLLIFVSPVFNEGQSRTSNELKRTRLCDAYVQDDPKCDGTGARDVDAQIVQDLEETCRNLGKCESLNRDDCARDCCIICPAPLRGG